ncbi:S24 family peptidase [Agathobaculum butyriciproducens]
MPEFKERLDEAMRIRDISAAELSRISKVNEGAISQYRAGKYKASQRSLDKLARALNVSIPWLMGADVPMTDEPTAPTLPSPTITEDTVTFPVITSVAAHYDGVSIDESTTGEKIEVPRAYLKGRKAEEFCAMRVRGDSMFPAFQNGDVVLVLRQSTMNHSGEIGVISYGDDEMTIKRINYVDGEDWLELVPLNPAYPPRRIEGVDLESCHVIGIPRVLIREF